MFSLPFASWLRSPGRRLAQLRFQVLAALQGCEGVISERIRWRIADTNSAHDLWLLRGRIFQQVANQFCQEEAVRRINALLPAFSGWLPARMLRPL